MSAHPDVLPRYLHSIVSKEGFGVCLSCQVKDRRFAPAVCSSHQQSVSPVFTVGVTLSKDICHKKNFSHLHSYFITICLCLLHCFVDISECASFLFSDHTVSCCHWAVSCTHQGQTAHTWPPSYSVQIQLQTPVLPSLSESYNLPALPQLPRGPEGLKESRIQEMGLREESEKSS